MTVLVLGGTAEARALAAALVAADVPCLTSLAGRVRRPRLPVGPTRIGGFGGAAGLAAYVRGQAVTAVVDATHPFAARISDHAASACRDAGVALVRLQRPGWADDAGAARWHWVDDHDEAAGVAARRADRVLLTTGRQQLHRFTAPLCDHAVLARVVDPVDEPLPPRWRLLLGRGPYHLDDELELMRDHGTQVLVTKDSGGSATRAKLDAADRLGVDVVVVRRPAPVEGVPQVSDVAAAARWVLRARG